MSTQPEPAQEWPPELAALIREQDATWRSMNDAQKAVVQDARSIAFSYMEAAESLKADAAQATAAARAEVARQVEMWREMYATVSTEWAKVLARFDLAEDTTADELLAQVIDVERLTTVLYDWLPDGADVSAGFKGDTRHLTGNDLARYIFERAEAYDSVDHGEDAAPRQPEPAETIGRVGLDYHGIRIAPAAPDTTTEADR